MVAPGNLKFSFISATLFSLSLVLPLFPGLSKTSSCLTPRVIILLSLAWWQLDSTPRSVKKVL